MLGYILYVLRGEGYSAVWLVHLKDKGNNSASLNRLGGASVSVCRGLLLLFRLISHFVGPFSRSQFDGCVVVSFDRYNPFYLSFLSFLNHTHGRLSQVSSNHIISISSSIQSLK